jgi:hypothetical protein
MPNLKHVAILKGIVCETAELPGAGVTPPHILSICFSRSTRTANGEKGRH